MKNLSKKIFIIFLTVAVVLELETPFLIAKAQRNIRGDDDNNGSAYENCVEWTLVWTNPPPDCQNCEPGDKVPVGYLQGLQPDKNPVRSTTGPPVLPVPFVDKAEWQCTEQDTALDSAQTELEGKGLVACKKAAELAAKFGGFTALDPDFSSKIQKSVLDNVNNFLQNEFKRQFNINISNPQQFIQQGIQGAIKIAEQAFNDLIGNPLKNETSKKAADIEKQAKDKLNQLKQNYFNNIPGTPGIPGLESAVPVEDKKAIEQQKAIEKKIDQQIAEQKIDRVIADTRQQCEQLLKTTVETIKKALLYQLSTQVVDWIQTGETPQFIKNPGRFLEDTGRLAVDRFISKVAPRLCEPFRLSIQAQISISQSQRINPFYEEVTCTLDRVVSNFEDFYKDFRKGGFIGYRELLNPRNNPYGLSILVQEEALMQQVKAQQEAEKIQTKGFIGQTRCTQWDKYVPGIGPVFANYQINNKNYMLVESDPNGPFDENGEIKEEFDPRRRNRPMPWPIRTGVRFSNSDGSIIWECSDYEITSPATVAASLTEKASQVDIDYLSSASDIENFLGTISDAIITKLTKAGLKGLKKLLPNNSILP